MGNGSDTSMRGFKSGFLFWNKPCMFYSDLCSFASHYFRNKPCTFDANVCRFKPSFLEQTLYVWLWFMSFWAFFGTSIIHTTLFMSFWAFLSETNLVHLTLIYVLLNLIISQTNFEYLIVINSYESYYILNEPWLLHSDSCSFESHYFWNKPCVFDSDICCFYSHYFCNIECLTLINVLKVLLFLERTLFTSLWCMFFWVSLFLEQTLYVWRWFIYF